MPAVSVIIPVFSGEELLKRCIDSIRSQSFADFELILVDDGSNDGCARICDEYALIDKRIRVIHQRNTGVSIARNAGLSLAVGEYITFCDGDDYYCSDLLKTAYKAISDSKSDIVSYRMKRLSETGQGSDNSHSEHGSYDLDEKNRFEFIYRVIRCETGGWQVCRSIFRNQIMQEHSVEFCKTCRNYAEDLGFTIEFLLYARRISFIDEELYIYDDTRESSMMNTSKDQIRVNDINELSFYLHNKVIGEYPDADYFILHHYLIRSHMIEAYKVNNINDFIVWADAIKTVKKSGFFITQNKLYFEWEKNQNSKLPITNRIKNLTNIEFAVNRYLADGDFGRLKRWIIYKRIVTKLFEVLYGRKRYRSDI